MPRRFTCRHTSVLFFSRALATGLVAVACYAAPTNAVTPTNIEPSATEDMSLAAGYLEKVLGSYDSSPVWSNMGMIRKKLGRYNDLQYA